MLNAVARNTDAKLRLVCSNQFEQKQRQLPPTRACSSQPSNDPSTHKSDSITCDIEIRERKSYGLLITLRQHSDPTSISADSDKHTRPEVDHSTESEPEQSLIDPSVVEKFLAEIATYLNNQPVPKQEDDIRLEVDTSSDGSSDSLLNKVFDFIETNYDQSISLSDVAQAIGYSPAYLTDFVRRHTGQPLHSWIIERRMKAARSLLLETDQSIAQIAVLVGYQDAGHFFRQFRQRHGAPPRAWRSAQRTSTKSQHDRKNR